MKIWNEGDRVQVAASFTIHARMLASTRDDTFAAGEYGTVSETTTDMVFIRMDRHHPSLDGYGNELWLDRHTPQEGWASYF